MPLKYRLLLVFTLIVALLCVFEYRYQCIHVLPIHGKFLITFRLALIAHLLFYAFIISVMWAVTRVFNSQTRQKILFLTTSLTFALFLGEILVRLSGTAAVYSERRAGYYVSLFQQPLNANPYHTHAPNNITHLKSAEFEYTRQTNSLGLRFPELPYKKDSNEIRIMALGDSFTDGDGAPEDSAWMNSLEYQLRKTHPNSKLTFINAGVCGSDVVSEYKLFKDKLLPYQPDILLVSTNISDIDDISLRGGFERFVTKDSCHFKDGPSWEKIYATSHLFRLLFLRNNNNLLLSNRKYEKEVQKSEEIIKATLNKFDSLTKQNNCKFVTILMPVAIDFIEKGKFHSLRAITDSLKNAPFSVINTYDCYATKHGINKQNAFDYYWKIDGHHNSKGYQVFGECVADYFEEHKLIEGIKSR